MSDKIRISRGLYKTTANPIELDGHDALQIINILHDCYEITSESYNRPYGDCDFKNTPYDNEDTFNQQDKLIGLALHKTISNYKFSISKSSSFKSKKISWRFVIKEWKGTKKAIKQLMIEINPLFQRNQQLLGVLHPVSLDFSVYDKHRKMRMLLSSKDGEDRPLILVEGTPEDTLITYIPHDVPHQELPEPVSEDNNDTTAPAFNKTKTLYPFEECEALINIIVTIPTWINSYEKVRNTVWAFWYNEQSQRMYDLLLRIVRKTTDAIHRDDIKFIRGLIKNYTPPANRRPITIATIYWLLKQHDDVSVAPIAAAVAELKSTYKQTWNHEIVGYQRPDWPVYEDWHNEAGYLKDLPIDKHNTLMVDSHLGTGKTTQMKKIVRAAPNKRIILISARRTFTTSMFNDWGDENGFVNYRDIKGPLTPYNKIFVQVESLHRLFDDNNNTIIPFDIILMDEVESILAQCSPSPTHQDNYLKNMDALAIITQHASKLIAMDAFVTERSIEFLNNLRGDCGLALVHNPYQPYKRIAIKAPNNNFRGKTSHFWKAVLETVKAGKRVTIPCGSVRQAIAFEKLLKANNITYLFYHSNDDRDMRKETLKDVNSSWAKVQVLLYTPSVTIGINYDAVDAQFDKTFMYFSAGGGTPRDLFQGSLRARVIKDNEMVFCLEKRGIKPHLLGLETIELAHQFKNDVTYKHCDYLGINTDKFIHLPHWNKQLIYRNKNEINVSMVEPEAVYNWYLEKCGYTIQEGKFTETVEYEPEQLPHLQDIVVITTSQAKVIEEKIRNEVNVSEDEHNSLNLHYLIQTVPNFLRIKTLLGWAAELSIWIQWNDKLIGRNHIKNVVAEKKTAKNLLITDLNKSKGCVDIVNGLANKIHTIKKLYEILGIGIHNQREQWTYSEFHAIIPTLQKFFDEGVALRTLGIRDRATGRKDAVYYIDKIKTVLKAWDGSKVESVETRKDIKVDGVKKTIRLYGMNITHSVVRKALPPLDEICILEDENED